MNDPVNRLLEQAVADGVAPLVRADVWYQGQHVFAGGNAPAHTVFDLASLTKVMCTTTLALDLGVPLHTPVGWWFPSAAARDVTVEQLLVHGSGLPAFRPYFAAVLEARPELFEQSCPAEARAAAREELVERVLAEPVVGPAGQPVYSDVGFILLGEIVSREVGPLDVAFTSRVALSLGLDAGFRRLSKGLVLPTALADTGPTRPREPAPGQEGLWQLEPRPTHRGEVDDDNAFCMDGVSGHAGLFGTGSAVAGFGTAVLEGKVVAPGGWTARCGTRTLGFDTAGPGASCGERFGRAGPKGAIGHTGFTGTSLWIDLDRKLVVALLTNRVASGRANIAIQSFRRMFHDAVLDALGLP